MLAWIRTALGFIAGGVAIVYIAPDVPHPAYEMTLGLVMVAAGCGIALTGASRWRKTTVALESGRELPGPVPVIGLVAAIVVVAILVAIAIVIQS
jgi:putative membrane protein